MFLQNSQENTCYVQPQACNFIKKETSMQMFSGEFCGIFKNIYFIEHLRLLLQWYHDLKYWKLKPQAFPKAYLVKILHNS